MYTLNMQIPVIRIFGRCASLQRLVGSPGTRGSGGKTRTQSASGATSSPSSAHPLQGRTRPPRDLWRGAAIGMRFEQTVDEGIECAHTEGRTTSM